MAQFRSTTDIKKAVLSRAGEVTDGTSSYDTLATDFLNRVHFSICAGGTIALGKDVTVEIDEVWPWSKSKRPLILELEPKYETGSIALTQGDTAGTFSAAPSYTVAGRYMRVDGFEGVYRIATHVASSASFTLDGAWPGSDVSAGTFSLFQLDYDLAPSYIVVDSTNNKIQFQETAGTTLTGTVASGVYAIADIPAAVAAAMQVVGASTYTVSYSATTKLFTIASGRTGGGGIFVLIGTGDQAAFSIHSTLGFDDADTANAASVVSTYVLGGIARLIEPMKIHRGLGSDIYGIDSESFTRDYPLVRVEEGNPDKFCVIAEGSDGSLRIRINKYPAYKTRIEAEFVPVPRDLKDSAASVPLIPRKHIDVLEDAATFYVMLLKNDDRAPTFAQLAQGKLTQMISQNRGQLLRAGNDFGRIIPRRDLKAEKRRFNMGYTYTSGSTSTSGTAANMTKKTLTYADFQATATSKTVTARTLAANRMLQVVVVKHSIAFVGSGLSAITLDLGIAGDPTKFINGFNLTQAVSSAAQDSALVVYFPGVGTDIQARLNATGGNTSLLSAGSVDIYFEEVLES